MAKIQSGIINGELASSAPGTSCGVLSFDVKAYVNGERITANPCTIYNVDNSISAPNLAMAIDFANIAVGQRFWMRVLNTDTYGTLTINSAASLPGGGFMWNGVLVADPVVIDLSAEVTEQKSLMFCRQDNNVVVIV